MKRSLKIAAIAAMALGGQLQAQTSYPVSTSAHTVNDSPWYGLGRSSKVLPGTTFQAVQLAGYYGLYMKTGLGQLTFNHQGLLGINTDNPQATLDIRTSKTTFETPLHLELEDASGDSFSIKNATGANNQFIPNLIGKHISDNREALYISGRIGSGNDSGTVPIMTFDSRIDGSTAQIRPLFAWDNNGNRKMLLTADGKLGLGTSSPTEKLTIAGNVNIGADGNASLRVRNLYGKSSSSSALDHLYLNYSSRKNVYVGSTNNQASFFVHGNIGIGTEQTHGYKLGVNGKIAALEVKVAKQANWPDFVFSKNYELPKLEEVALHIKEKGHLKNIPSAKEVGENGFFLAQMDAKLLQKIEELTLYTIAQEQQLTAQRKQNERQQREIEALKKQNKLLTSLVARIANIEKKLKKD